MSDTENKMTGFEKIVKRWTIHDHFNPSIKAEVIWDMLLSEFITEIIAYCMEDNLKNVGNYVLLAKEFPISNETKNAKTGEYTLASAKIDYLIVKNASEPEVIMVELKTTNDSVGETQLKRYINYVISENSCPKGICKNSECEKEDTKECTYRHLFWKHYVDILEANLTKNSSKKTESELRSSEKYINQVLELEKKIGNGFDNRELNEYYQTLNKNLQEKYADAQFKLIYLSMTKIKKFQEILNDCNVKQEYKENIGNYAIQDKLLNKVNGKWVSRGNFEQQLEEHPKTKEKLEAWNVLVEIIADLCNSLDVTSSDFANS